VTQGGPATAVAPSEAGPRVQTRKGTRHVMHRVPGIQQGGVKRFPLKVTRACAGARKRASASRSAGSSVGSRMRIAEGRTPLRLVNRAAPTRNAYVPVPPARPESPYRGTRMPGSAAPADGHRPPMPKRCSAAPPPDRRRGHAGSRHRSALRRRTSHPARSTG